MLALGYSAYRIAWGKPFTVNPLVNRQALEFLLRGPDLLTAVDRHSGRLGAVGVQKRDGFDDAVRLSAPALILPPGSPAAHGGPARQRG